MPYDQSADQSSTDKSLKAFADRREAPVRPTVATEAPSFFSEAAINERIHRVQRELEELERWDGLS